MIARPTQAGDAGSVGKSAFTGRRPVRHPRPPPPFILGDTNEHGWALTAAWRYPLSKLLDVRLEAMHIQSDRPGRTIAGEATDARSERAAIEPAAQPLEAV